MDGMELPPPVQMVQMLAGFQVAQALYVVAALGVPDRLVDGPLPAAALADLVGADPDALRRVLRTLAGMGVFSEVAAGTYALTPLGETLSSDHPGSMRDLAIMWMETHYAPFGHLLEGVRTGQVASDLHYGRPFFDWLSEQPAQVARFTGAMANLTDGIKAGAVSSVSLEGVTRLVDVGGADGAFLSLVLAAHPDVRAVLFDLPHVVADAPKSLAARGVADRVECVGGSFFESIPGGDGYILSLVLHDWNDEQALHILGNVVQAGGPGARLYVVEAVVPPGDTPHMGKMIDLTMLAMLTGRERSATEWRGLLDAAGFAEVTINETPTPLSVISAVVA
jgi:hypothetical protein